MSILCEYESIFFPAVDNIFYKKKKAIGLIVNGDPPKLDAPEKHSPDLNSFIAECLIKDPTKRPNASGLLTVVQMKHFTKLIHPFFFF